MTIKSLVFSILTCFLMSASTALGAGLCSNLFETPSKISTDPRDYLSKDKLDKEGFHLSPDQFGRIVLVQRDGRIIGEVAITVAERLYQWGPLEYQKSYLENKGIDKDLMKEIIEDPPQNFGKGFYVSTIPYDSSYYGEGITAFMPISPIVTIKDYYGSDKVEKIKAFSTEMIRKLQDLNIDAIQAGQQSWLSMIGHKHLVTTKKIPSADPFWSERYLKYQALLLANFKASGVHTWLPKNHIIRRILSKKLTPADVVLLRKLRPFKKLTSPIYGEIQVHIAYDANLGVRSAVASHEAYQESLNLINQALKAAGSVPIAL